MPSDQPDRSAVPGAPSENAAGASPDGAGVARTLLRHPRPLGGDPLRRVDRPLVSLSGQVLNNADGRPQQLATKRKPPWLKAKMPGGRGYEQLRGIMDEHRLHTVCEEAGCPNMGECWARGVATIMILGDTCTRSCGFCNVKTGRPGMLDRDEPRRVAESLALMGLRHVVITSVNRDELSDGGAGVWAETIVRTREACPNMSIEVLIPDFEGNWAALQMVIDAGPHIINHNLETVPRMYPAVRPSAKFERSLELLRRVKEQGRVAKTGIMVGIGERDEEVEGLMREVQGATRVAGRRDEETERRRDEVKKGQRDKGTEAQTQDSTVRGPGEGAAHGGSTSTRRLSVSSSLDSDSDSCDILTIGQYLQPTRNHLPIDRWVTPERFAAYRQFGLAAGFKVVESGPLVRSSYHADEQADRLTGIERETHEKMGALIEAARGRRG